MQGVPGFVPRVLRDAEVGLFRAEDRVFDAMLDGWKAQMLARGLTTQTIEGRCGVLRRFQGYAGTFPWTWRPVDLDDHMAERRSGVKPISLTTLRADSNAIAMSYVSSPTYAEHLPTPAIPDVCAQPERLPPPHELPFRPVKLGSLPDLDCSPLLRYHRYMKTMSISAAKAKLNELVDDAARTHEHVTLTKNGSPAAVMISADEWESIQDTLFWQSQPGIREDLAQAGQDIAAGNTVSAQGLRDRYGLPPLG